MPLPDVDVLIPTFERPEALAVTLTSLASQTYEPFRVIIADQSLRRPSTEAAYVQTVLRRLEMRGNQVTVHRRRERLGLAEQRHFLLSEATAPYVLFLDDDLLLDADVMSRLVATLRREDCGFAGMAPIGLSYADDWRPHEQHFEPWDGRVRPEVVRPDSPAWRRHVLHNAANLLHLQRSLELPPDACLAYKVAWVGGCVLYHRQRLIEAGGFGFWRDLPAEHSGEDVLAQLLVMARDGGCGVAPSGVYHLELETTVPDRRCDAPRALQHLLVAASSGSRAS